MKWTTELRYKRYDDWSEAEKNQLNSTMEKSPWRAKYHVEPSSGLLNDPNGFSYFDVNGFYSTKTFFLALLMD